jgi:hypothetical protein
MSDARKFNCLPASSCEVGLEEEVDNRFFCLQDTFFIGMAMGRVRIGYGKYPPAIIPAGITHIRQRLYPRVGFCTPRTHRVSGGYRIPAGTTTWTATHDFLWRHGWT